MMELFTLGADRGAYTERDVREQARSLTGWRNNWKPGRGDYNFHFDLKQHDDGMKTVFHKAGRFNWQGACKLCISHPLHPSFFVQKLWSYFIPTVPDHATEAALIAVYRNGWQVKPVVAGDPRAPGALRRPAHGQAADRASRRAAAPDRRRHHDHRLGVDRLALRAAALLPAERRRLGRHPLARHRDVPRALDRRRADPPGPQARPREGEESGWTPTPSSIARSRSGTSRRCPTRPTAR